MHLKLIRGQWLLILVAASFVAGQTVAAQHVHVDEVAVQCEVCAHAETAVDPGLVQQPPSPDLVQQPAPRLSRGETFSQSCQPTIRGPPDLLP